MRHLLSVLFVVALGSTIQAQKLNKMEKLLQTQQKWTVRDVKSSRPYWEVGEALSMRVDRKFYHDRNNYAKLGGEWSIDKKELILIYDSFTEERRRIPYEYKIKKWEGDGFMLKYRNRYNKTERVYFK